MMNIIKNLKGKKLLLAIVILALLPLALVACDIFNNRDINKINAGGGVNQKNIVDSNEFSRDPLTRISWAARETKEEAEERKNIVKGLEDKANTGELDPLDKEYIDESIEKISFLEGRSEQFSNLADLLEKAYRDPSKKRYIQSLGYNCYFYPEGGKLYNINYFGKSELIYDPTEPTEYVIEEPSEEEKKRKEEKQALKDAEYNGAQVEAYDKEIEGYRNAIEGEFKDNPVARGILKGAIQNIEKQKQKYLPDQKGQLTQSKTGSETKTSAEKTNNGTETGGITAETGSKGNDIKTPTQIQSKTGSETKTGEGNGGTKTSEITDGTGSEVKQDSIPLTSAQPGTENKGNDTKTPTQIQSKTGSETKTPKAEETNNGTEKTNNVTETGEIKAETYKIKLICSKGGTAELTFNNKGIEDEGQGNYSGIRPGDTVFVKAKPDDRYRLDYVLVQAKESKIRTHNKFNAFDNDMVVNVIFMEEFVPSSPSGTNTLPTGSSSNKGDSSGSGNTSTKPSYSSGSSKKWIKHVFLKGTNCVGGTITVTVTYSDNSTTEKSGTEYAWYQSGQNLALDSSDWLPVNGQTSKTFRELTTDDIGQYFKVEVTYGGKTEQAKTTTAVRALVDVDSVSLSDDTPEFGQEIMATPVTIPADSAEFVTYQWYRQVQDDEYKAISTAKSAEYTVVAADVDKKLKVTVTGETGDPKSAVTDAVARVANDLALFSQATLPLTVAAGDAHTSQITLTGGEGAGTITYSSSDSSKATVSDTGLVTAVAEGSATITISQEQGATMNGTSPNLTVSVTVVDDAVALESVTWSGTAKVGQTLTASITSGATGTIAYQWLSSSDGENYTAITGATSSTYVIQSTDAGKTIKVQATQNGGTPVVSTTATSAVPYTITKGTMSHGDITISATEAAANASVLISSVTADDDYVLTALSYTQEGHDPVSIDISGSAPYSFTMPAGNITVNATFAEKQPALDTPLVLKAAPLEDHPSEGEPIPTLYSAYSLTANDDAATTDKIEYAMSAENLVKHHNANHVEDYWIGIAIPEAPTGVTPTYTLDCESTSGDTDVTTLFTNRTWVDGGTTYNTLYLDKNDYVVTNGKVTLKATYSAENKKTVTYTYDITVNVTRTYSVTTTLTEASAASNNGWLGLSAGTALTGNTITITPHASNGYKLDSLSYNDGESHSITLTGASTYSFTMGTANVIVSGKFVAKSSDTTVKFASETGNDGWTINNTGHTITVPDETTVAVLAGKIVVNDASATSKIVSKDAAAVTTAEGFASAKAITPTTTKLVSDDKMLVMAENGTVATHAVTVSASVYTIGTTSVQGAKNFTLMASSYVSGSDITTASDGAWDASADAYVYVGGTKASEAGSTTFKSTTIAGTEDTGKTITAIYDATGKVTKLSFDSDLAASKSAVFTDGTNTLTVTTAAAPTKKNAVLSVTKGGEAFTGTTDTATVSDTAVNYVGSVADVDSVSYDGNVIYTAKWKENTDGTYAENTEKVAVTEAGAVTFKAAGIVKLTISAPGTSTFNEATPIVITVTVTFEDAVWNPSQETLIKDMSSTSDGKELVTFEVKGAKEFFVLDPDKMSGDQPKEEEWTNYSEARTVYCEYNIETGQYAQTGSVSLELKQWKKYFVRVYEDYELTKKVWEGTIILDEDGTKCCLTFKPLNGGDKYKVIYDKKTAADEEKMTASALAVTVANNADGDAVKSAVAAKANAITGMNYTDWTVDSFTGDITDIPEAGGTKTITVTMKSTNAGESTGYKVADVTITFNPTAEYTAAKTAIDGKDETLTAGLTLADSSEVTELANQDAFIAAVQAAVNMAGYTVNVTVTSNEGTAVLTSGAATNVVTIVISKDGYERTWTDVSITNGNYTG